MGNVKTTVELPDTLFRKAKAAAAEEGRSLKDFFKEAVQDRLRRATGQQSSPKQWEAAFGGLRALHRENLRIDRIIQEEFESIDEDEWR
jgi:predicted transcriptional regulator